MPQLIHFALDGCRFLPLSNEKRSATIALLQRMPLTQLIRTGAKFADLQWLQYLPHLSVCTLGRECCAESVAAAPSLQDLTCDGCAVVLIAAEWWRRCGYPPLQHLDQFEGRRHFSEGVCNRTAAAVAPPIIRVLRCPISPFRTLASMPARAFPYLAHLPLLRELDCCLSPSDFRALGLLPQLEKLRLNLSLYGATLESWRDELVRSVGALPLQRLLTLRLEGDDEHSQQHQDMRPDDPDFPCQSTKSKLCGAQRRRSRGRK
jgi:hypothetical protein